MSAGSERYWRLRIYLPKQIESCVNCDLDAHARGLCLGHYARAYRRVGKRQTTWDILIASGEARAMKVWPEGNNGISD